MVASQLPLVLLASGLVHGQSCTVETDTDYSGNDLTPVTRRHASSPEECCNICTANTDALGCKFWTFMPSGTCYLKNSDSGRRSPFNNYTSGNVGPTPPTPPTPPPTPPPPPPPFSCSSDWDCSLAGVCDTTSGSCTCDAWTRGEDCSYLNLLPVDKARLGYNNSDFSSWGGNAIFHEGQYHAFPVEINCGRGASCGLSGWGQNSQVAHAISAHPEGPYERVELALPAQHHNPTVHIDPQTGDWLIHSISCCGNGQISVARSSNGPSGPWVVNDKYSTHTNPGPYVRDNGTVMMFFRASATGVGPCSTESIGLAICNHINESSCTDWQNPLYQHTGEDPSVFVDKRGNWHMLTNALPGGCNPKELAGGHSWSRDGWTWSEPRLNTFNTTVQFTDGSSNTFGDRERPQVVLDRDGNPGWLWTGTTGRTSWDGIHTNPAFTLVQALGRPAQSQTTIAV